MACRRAGGRRAKACVRPAACRLRRGCSPQQRITRKGAVPAPVPLTGPLSRLPLLRLRPRSMARPPGCPVSGSRRARSPARWCAGGSPGRLPLGDAPTGGSGERGAAGHSRRAICDRREGPEDWERWGRSPGPGGSLVGGPRALSTDRAGGPFSSAASGPRTTEGAARGGEARGALGFSPGKKRWPPDRQEGASGAQFAKQRSRLLPRA